MEDVPTKLCEFCGVPIREVDVLVGIRPSHARPGDPPRMRRRWISVEAEPDGEVIQRADDVWRTLPHAQIGAAVVPAFRIHGRTRCEDRVGDSKPGAEFVSA